MAFTAAVLTHKFRTTLNLVTEWTLLGETAQSANWRSPLPSLQRNNTLLVLRSCSAFWILARLLGVLSSNCSRVPVMSPLRWRSPPKQERQHCGTVFVRDPVRIHGQPADVRNYSALKQTATSCALLQGSDIPRETINVDSGDQSSQRQMPKQSWHPDLQRLPAPPSLRHAPTSLNSLLNCAKATSPASILDATSTWLLLLVPATVAVFGKCSTTCNVLSLHFHITLSFSLSFHFSPSISSTALVVARAVLVSH